MKVSELIEQLEEIIKEYGDLPVYYFADAYPDQAARGAAYHTAIEYTDMRCTLPDRVLIM